MTLLIIKIAVSVAVIISLSVIAEHVSPRMSGILSGYPLGAALSLFFIGVETTPEFAAGSATYTLLGLISTQLFVTAYYLVSKYVISFSILFSSLGAILVFLLSTCFLQTIMLPEALILPLTCCSTLFFILLFKNIKNEQIKKRKNLSFSTLLLRAATATVIIVAITTIASSVGERWAGLLSSFPVTLFPLLLIIHGTYDQVHVHTIIKNVPQGLGSLIIYLITVHHAYPIFGLFLGTVSAFAAATVYLLLFLYLSEHLSNPQTGHQSP